MGSTADDLQYEQREQTSPQRVMVASGAGTTGAAVKWRIAQRVVPINDHDLVLTPIDPDKLHPLVSVSSSAKDETAKPVTDVVAPVVSTPLSSSTANLSGDAEQKASTTSLSGGATEVVALEAGELDPLGALAMGLSIEGVSGQKTPASVDATQRSSMSRTTSFTSAADQALGTIKHLWTAHKDRVLAKLSDETFTIKASMLETNDIEGELSYSSTSEYQSREEDGLMTSSADGTAVVRKSRARLEQLERRHSSVSTAASLNRAGSTVKITQREYVARIKQMQADLVKAWQQNMKVQALRIAIKCVKQLSDTSSAPQLYPLAFVLVSDVLDEFGQLVFTRIKARASEDENGQPLPTPLGERFTSDEVNIHAKETCRNWFYKTACIRELLPRIYIEIALLKSYRFLGDGEFPQIVARLSNMIKGVGEPMVALYTRLYLALASTELVNPSEKAAVLSSLYDYFFAFQQYQDQGKLTQFLYDQNLTHNDYLELHSPAVEWLMKCTAQHATNEVFEALLEQYQEYSRSSMVLKHLCESFGASSYASDPMRIFHLMRVASPSQFSKCHLYSVLAVQLSTTPSIGAGSKDAKLRFLNEAWSSITAQEDIEMYMECAAAYMKLIVSHYAHREATILLKDVMRHLNSTTPDELTPKLYNLLGAFIENVVYGAQQHAEFFTRLIPSGEFLSLMGMFRREASVGVAKKVLQAFVNAQGSQKNNFGNLRLHVVGPEAAVAHTLFVICCRVHDALDSLSTASERNDATKDIAAFILRLGYARHPLAASSSTVLSANMPTTDAQLQEEEEALLMFYIDCRSAFYKLEPIKSVLTKCVTALALRVRERMLSAASRHKSGGPRVTDRRRDFIKSCLAYAHITIPSIDQAFPRLELLALCAKAALINNCLPQLEAFLKSAIVLVADLDYVHSVGSTFDGHLVHEAVYPDMSDAEVDPVLRVIRELVQIVTYAPSTVDDEPFYFVEALRKALLERMKWDDATSSTSDRVRLQASSCRIRVIIAVAQLYATWGQSRLPSRVEGVVSNDVLYGVDDAFQQQTQMAFSAILDQVVRDIEALSSAFTTMPSWEVASMQTELLVELVSVVFPFLSFEEDQAPGDGIDDKPTAPTELMEEDRRQNKRGRSGATLLRKCLLFAMEKLRIVTDEPDQQYQEKKGQRVEALKVKLLDVVKSLHEYVQYQQKKRALLYSAVAGQALNSLETVTSTLTGPA